LRGRLLPVFILLWAVCFHAPAAWGEERGITPERLQELLEMSIEAHGVVDVKGKPLRLVKHFWGETPEDKRFISGVVKVSNGESLSYRGIVETGYLSRISYGCGISNGTLFTRRGDQIANFEAVVKVLSGAFSPSEEEYKKVMERCAVARRMLDEKRGVTDEYRYEDKFDTTTARFHLTVFRVADLPYVLLDVFPDGPE